MKKFNCFYVDDFLMEKVVYQWISPKMLKTYSMVFRFLFSSSHIIPSDLSTYTSQNFKRLLGDSFQQRDWTSATYNTYRKCLKCYCGYLVNEEFLQENPFDKITKRKEPQQLPRSLTSEQVEELLRALPEAFDRHSFVGLWNSTMVYTYLYTGLRLSELTNLKYSDLKLMDWYLKVVKGKWAKDRIVPLYNGLIKLLHRYLKKAKDNLSDDGFLFPTIHGNALGERDMRTMIDKIRCCLSFHFTWHQLRHTFATELVRNNFDVYIISKILGHSKIDTTKIYLSIDVWRVKKQLDWFQLFSQVPHFREIVLSGN